MRLRDRRSEPAERETHTHRPEDVGVLRSGHQVRTLGDAGRRLEFIARQHPYLGDNGTGELQHYDAFGSYERLSWNRCLHARVYSITVHMTRNVEAPRALRHGAHATCAVDEPRGHHALGDAPGAEARMPRDSTRSRSLESPHS